MKFLATALIIGVGASFSAATLVASGTYGGKLYELWETGTTDYAAQSAFAESVSGRHLATLTTTGENDFAAALLADNGVAEANIGGYQYDTSGGPADGWGWVTGEVWDPSFAPWSGGEPNDFTGVDEVVLELYSNGLWNDEGASVLSSYAVTEAVPEPGTMAALALGLAAMRRRSKKA